MNGEQWIAAALLLGLGFWAGKRYEFKRWQRNLWGHDRKAILWERRRGMQ